MRHVLDQREAVATRHSDIAEKKIGRKFARALEGFICGVSCLRRKTISLEDESQCIGNQTIIINYQNSLHAPSLSNLIGSKRNTCLVNLAWALKSILVDEK